MPLHFSYARRLGIEDHRHSGDHRYGALSRRRCVMPTAAIGDASSARSSKSRPTTALSALGEMGGGGESAEAVFRAMKSYLLGHDPARIEEMRFKIANPTASLYNNRTQMLAALEFACLDILGQAWGVPVSEILGGRLRDRVPFASYLLLPLSQSARPEPARFAPSTRCSPMRERSETPKYGFTTHKVKAGVFPSGLRTGGVPGSRRDVPGRPHSIRSATPSGRPSRPSVSDRRSRDCGTTIWKIPCTA